MFSPNYRYGGMGTCFAESHAASQSNLGQPQVNSGRGRPEWDLSYEGRTATEVSNISKLPNITK